MVTNGIDISRWQDTVNFNRVKAAGYTFVIARGAYSATEDIRFASFAQGANAAGLIFGSYYFATWHYSGNSTNANAVSKARQQAEYFVSVLKKQTITGPAALDLEFEVGRGTDLSMNVLVAGINAFLKVVEDAGYSPLLYIPVNIILEYNIDTDAINYDFWAAYFYNNPDPNNFPNTMYGRKMNEIKNRIAIWQYSETGIVDGIEGFVDLNFAYRNLAAGSGSSGNTGGSSSGSTSGGGASDTSRRATIRSIQNRMNTYYGTNLAVDGVYGPKTKKALVIGLQKELNNQFKRGLAIDGIYGPRTKAAMVNIRKKSRGNLTYILQALLFVHGFNTGGVDGIFGAQTKKAVKAFQKANGLTADGTAGRETFSKLLL